MKEQYQVLAIVGICGLVLLIGVMKQKARVAAAFISRIAVGVVGICVVNEILAAEGIAVAVGVNPISALTIGALGISGFALLYGILFYRLL